MQSFIRKLNGLAGRNYRLPTEAEWEYAARGGQNYKYAGANNIENVAWYAMNSGGKTHLVGQKAPNGFGLYDMTGNVWEWCSDWYGAYSSGSKTNPLGPTSGVSQVDRGGSWLSDTRNCRVSYRNGIIPDKRYSAVGFRLVASQ